MNLLSLSSGSSFVPRDFPFACHSGGGGGGGGDGFGGGGGGGFSSGATLHPKHPPPAVREAGSFLTAVSERARPIVYFKVRLLLLRHKKERRICRYILTHALNTMKIVNPTTHGEHVSLQPKVCHYVSDMPEVKQDENNGV
jgi:hypothetical protein